MLTKQQLNIFSVFKQDIFKELTFKQIKEQSKQKSNNVTQLALEEFRKQNLVITKKVGDVNSYSLNLKNNLVYSYLNLIDESDAKSKRIPRKVLDTAQDKVSKYTPFFVILIFGSYAKGKATEKSDLDVAIIVESDKTKKEITPYLETIRRREIAKMDYHIFTSEEFLEMLKSDQENVGKQIYRENIKYYGSIYYYQLIKRLKNEQFV
ncbi:MAG: nucleotidyltransferase domain-containing protein [Candidatus Woesearchaeota archaeon]